jgi:hypothetical protein
VRKTDLHPKSHARSDAVRRSYSVWFHSPIRRSAVEALDAVADPPIGKDYEAHPAFWTPFVLVGRQS